MPLNPAYAYLFNSYYETIGEQYPRPQRGLLSRPTVDEVYTYRSWVDELIAELLTASATPQVATMEPIVELGLHHEQQHQELILTDIKHLFGLNPLHPAYQSTRPLASLREPSLSWLPRDG